MCGLCQLACNAKRSIIFEYSSWIVRDFVRTKYMHDTFLILSHEKNRVSNFCLYEIQYMTTIVITQKQACNPQRPTTCGFAICVLIHDYSQLPLSVQSVILLIQAPLHYISSQSKPRRPDRVGYPFMSYCNSPYMDSCGGDRVGTPVYARGATIRGTNAVKDLLLHSHLCYKYYRTAFFVDIIGYDCGVLRIAQQLT